MTEASGESNQNRVDSILAMVKELPIDHDDVIELCATCIYRLVMECSENSTSDVREPLATIARRHPDIAARIVRRTQYLLAEVGQESKINLVMGLED